MGFWQKIFGKRRPVGPQAAFVAEGGSLPVQPKSVEAVPEEPSAVTISRTDDRGTSYYRGKDFERLVQDLLWRVQARFPSRVKVNPQVRLKLFDGRIKVIDFAFEYQLASSRNQIAVECQDRESWSTEIIDKILAIRNHSYRNRFWFVYHDDSFLSGEAKDLFKRHGILCFSLSTLQAHLAAVSRDLSAVEEAQRRQPPFDYEGTIDPIG